MTQSDIDILLLELDAQIINEFGDSVQITHEVDLANSLINTIIELSIQLGMDLENFIDATLFPFLVELDIDGLSIISNIEVLLNGDLLESRPSSAGLDAILGVFGGILGSGGTLPEIIDLWHVIVIQPEACCPFETTISWSDTLLNPFSSDFLTSSIAIGRVLMTADY